MSKAITTDETLSAVEGTPVTFGRAVRCDECRSRIQFGRDLTCGEGNEGYVRLRVDGRRWRGDRVACTSCGPAHDTVPSGQVVAVATFAYAAFRGPGRSAMVISTARLASDVTHEGPVPETLTAATTGER